MITSAEIRARFLRYFEEHGHTIVQSSSLLPGNDPTLLFVNAGMVPFKDVFTGAEVRPYLRATTSQKCMRVSGKHNDLDSVGPSPRHHTFFEMLGNFSFGDYFKREAITFAWTFLTKEMGLDPDRLWPTIYTDDDEAFALWQEIAGLPPERITRLDAKSNYWSMGDTGPNGPCSEIIYDRGPEACTCGNPNCTLADECDRWLELWNLVFMQFETHADGTTTPLPRPSIDTGLGLERITSVLQNVDNNYDTDVFMPIMERMRELAGMSIQEMRANIVPFRVIADHSRAIAFLIADGVMPGNEGRNYVLRMVLRRAARFGRKLGMDRPFLAETTQVVIDTMGQHYVELVERGAFIKDVVTQEEERFLQTLSVGLTRLEELTSELGSQGKQTIPGDEAFRLYDTFGFPLELTRDAAEEAGFSVDEKGFAAAMAAQKERARGATRFAADNAAELYRSLDLKPTVFCGYETCDTQATVLAIVRNGESVSSASENSEISIVLDTTPFYGESGGQVGDTGYIVANDLVIEVTNSTRPLPGLFAHHAIIRTGTVSVGDSVIAQVDEERRLDIARNHTATHLLHRALRQILGEHAAQSGSLVAPEHLRFDFSHLSAMSTEQLRQVEDIVNAEIRQDAPVSTRETSLDEARQQGVIALFGEKYGDRVRVVNVEGFSSELCGGTHLHSTGQIGCFFIKSEASVGSGLRRIEAVTGRGALAFVRNHMDRLNRVGELVSSRPGEEAERVAALMQEVKDQRKNLQDLQREIAAKSVDSLTDSAVEISGTKVLTAVVQAVDVDTLRDMCDQFRDKLGSGVVGLGAVIDEKPLLIVSITADLVKRGLHAGKLAGAAARLMGGGGGGKPHMAQAGGKDASKIEKAVSNIKQLVTDALN